jgi:CHAD domain-containing protein
MRDAGLFAARRGRGWRDVERALARTFDLEVEARPASELSYCDTFDWRLYRAGLHVVADGAALSLRDSATGEVIAEGKWRTAAPPRFARDLDPPALRDRVSAVTEPRVLLEVVRARVVVHEALARDARGRVVGRIRHEAATVRRHGKPRTERVAWLGIPREAERLRSGEALRGALASAGYRPETASAYDRLLVLAGIRPAAHAPRPRVELDAAAPLRVATVVVFRHLLRVMERNESGVREGVDPEFLHDYRVALRRTRTALAEFKGVFVAEEARSFRERFATLSGPSGRVRDLDVHLMRRTEYAEWIPAAFRAAFAPAIASLEREREARRAELLALLAGRDYAALKRDWKRALSGLAAGRPAGVASDEPALPAARAAIARRYARLRSFGASVDALDDAALHRARVQSKRLRYVLEFFAHPLGEAADDAVLAIERLQDALGAHHDAGVLLSMLGAQARAIPAGDRDAVARGAALGALMASLESRRAKWRRRAVRRLAGLLDRKSERAFARVLAD